MVDRPHTLSALGFLTTCLMLGLSCLALPGSGYGASLPSQGALEVGSVYYLAVSGSDNSDGSVNHPWATFEHALSRLGPGDTLIIAKGIYPQTLRVENLHGTADRPITIKAQSNAAVVVDGQTKRMALWVRDSSYVTVEGIYARDCYNPNVVAPPGGICSPVQIQSSAYVTLRRVTARNARGMNDGFQIKDGSHHVLIEDSASYGHARNGIVPYLDTHHVTVRRFFNYWEAYANPDHPESTWCTNMEVYGGHDQLVENFIGFQKDEARCNHAEPVHGVLIAGLGTRLLGSIAYKPTGNGFYFTGCSDCLMQDVVAIGSGGEQGIHANISRFDTPIVGNRVRNFTWINHRPYGRGVSFGKADSTSTIDVRQSSLHGEATANAFYNRTEGTITHRYNTFSGIDADNLYVGTTAGAGEGFVNVDWDTATYGDGAYLMASRTVLNGAGEGGMTIGADVLYRYLDGQRTDEPLWPWPMEARICAETAREGDGIHGLSVTYQHHTVEYDFDGDGKPETYDCSGGLWKTLEGVYAPGPTFADVPLDHPFHDAIEALYDAGYTTGCGTEPLRYCPDRALTRAEGAVFVERGFHGVDVIPGEPTEQVFADVASGAWYANWTHALWEDGYTAGCEVDPLRFCPERSHTRAEGSVFVLRMLHGAVYEAPEAAGIFVDVPVDTWYARWVEAAYGAGLLPACGDDPLRICPQDPLTRGLMAYMVVRAKGLTLP